MPSIKCKYEPVVTLDKVNNIYNVNGIPLDRVTTWIQLYYKEFNAINAAIGVRKRCNNNNEQSLLPNELVHYWSLLGQKAASYGTAVHLFAELYDLDNRTEPINGFEIGVKDCINALASNYEVVGNELKVFNINAGLCGTIDRLLRNKLTGKYLILDWKTSKEIDKSYNNMLAPFNNYPHSKRTVYTIQLNTYKCLGSIETKDGIINISKGDFEGLWLIILNLDGTFTVEVCDDMTELITMELNKRNNARTIIQGL